MRAFKGFNKDLTCRGYQYEEGKEFHTERAECCDTGFHACEYPLDCFGYYDPAHSVFYEVELSGEMDKSGDNTKVCATDIKIGARLSVAGLVKMAIDFTMSKVNKEAGSDERHGFASATGNYGASSATGYKGASYILPLYRGRNCRSNRIWRDRGGIIQRVVHFVRKDVPLFSILSKNPPQK